MEDGFLYGLLDACLHIHFRYGHTLPYLLVAVQLDADMWLRWLQVTICTSFPSDWRGRLPFYLPEIVSIDGMHSHAVDGRVGDFLDGNALCSRVITAYHIIILIELQVYTVMWHILHCRQGFAHPIKFILGYYCLFLLYLAFMGEFTFPWNWLWIYFTCVHLRSRSSTFLWLSFY
jgi:hypothetical protein